jgi:hypothetical protein
MVPGKWTTGTVAQIRQANTHAWRIRSTWTVAPYSVFALRTADGGTFVWYSVTENGSAVNRRNGPAISLNPGAAALAGHTTMRDTFHFRTQYQFGAEIQPTGKIAVAAEIDLMTQVQGR